MEEEKKEVEYPENKKLKSLKDEANEVYSNLKESVKGIKEAKLEMFKHYKVFEESVSKMPELFEKIEKEAIKIDWIRKDEKE